MTLNTRLVALPLAALAVVMAAVLNDGVLSTTAGVPNAGTTFTVNSTGDLPDADPADGQCQTSNTRECTLRAAIQQANAQPQAYDAVDAVTFNIPGPGIHTIRPESPLPALLGQVTVDGYTQPGSVPDSDPLDLSNDAVLKIEIDGSPAGPAANGLTIFGDPQDWDRMRGITIQGLVINRFPGNGIDSRYASGIRVVGNFIGTDASGEIDLGNGGSAIFSVGSFTRISGNVLSGNDEYGLTQASQEAWTSSNLIGTSADGTRPVGNARGGVFLRPGIDFEFHRNLISGNLGPGLQTVNDDGFYAKGNLIGTQIDGKSPLGNQGSGVVFVGSSRGVSFGASRYDPQNVIAFNRGHGIEILEHSDLDLGVNSIHSNGGLGIDLGGDGITRNDRLDEDYGPNYLQNFPEIESARATTSRLTIRGWLRSGLTPPHPYHGYFISVYSNRKCDPSGYGEGETYLGSIQVVTDSRGRARFEATFPVMVPAGAFITATATSNTWETSVSEFSRCQRVANGFR